MQIGLVRVHGRWAVAVRPRTAGEYSRLPGTFKTPWGALWASRKYWKASDG